MVSNHIKDIKLKLIELILKIYFTHKYILANEYLNELSNYKIETFKNVILNGSTFEVKSIFELSIKLISTNLAIKKNEDINSKYLKQKLNYENQLKKEKNKSKEYNGKYNLIIKSLNEYSKVLNGLEEGKFNLLVSQSKFLISLDLIKDSI